MRLETKAFQFEQFELLPQILKWTGLSCLIALLAGTASAALLISLEWATDWRESHLWIIALLPLAGLVIGWSYHRFGESVQGGNNLLIDEIHDPRSVVPLRMAPLVFFGTVVTHVFGGSAGREGTALQMAGSLADQLTFPFRLSPEDRRILLMAGLSAGFGSVFGTPLAGALFGLEVLAIGRLRYDAIFPCFVSAILAHQVTLAWGIHHTIYTVPFTPGFSPIGLISALIAGAAFGIVGMLFAKTTHKISDFFKSMISYAPLRPLVGGSIVAAAVFALGTTKYIGLGIPTILESFSKVLSPADFSLKFLFTALTLGCGFIGGEVTPLFFIGATLGSFLGHFLGLPAPLLAGMGFVGVFAGAANVPLASTLMAIELFGPQAGVYAGIACVSSYLFSGHAGIYQAQRVGLSKNASFRTKAIPALDLIKELHFMGFVGPEVNSMENKLAALRVYFYQGKKVHAEGFLGKLMARPLGVQLLDSAQEFGIRQALIHPVTSGFMNGEAVRRDIGDVPPRRLPSCLELVDDEVKLLKFAEAHLDELTDVRVVLLRCEEPILDTAGNKNTARAILEKAEVPISE